jgi:hypothetical protein
VAAVSHVLDTSALLAHYFDEAGAEIVGLAREILPGVDDVALALCDEG